MSDRAQRTSTVPVQLPGLSGAEVRLMADDRGHWFVRKMACDVPGAERLRRQAEKQRSFAAARLGIRTPRVLQDGEVDGRYYFDMEYIRGLDGASYLRRASYAEITRFTKELCQFLGEAASRAALCASPYASFFEALFGKICQVQRSTGLISNDTLARLFLLLDTARQLASPAATLCHGDLTLQNMIVDHEGTVWAIDLLDTAYEHYWQDVAKLHQDIVGGWFLVDQEPIAQCVLAHVSRELLQRASELDADYAVVHHLLLAATFARILPYAKTPRQVEFVLARIDYFAEQGCCQL